MTLLSFIIPAHNESFEIGRTLAAIQTAAARAGRPYEVIVVNDASTDDTAAIARQARARVLDVNKRQISAVRNAGARAAIGDALFFVDADTRITEVVLRGAIDALDRGAIGGGARVELDGAVGTLVRLTLPIFNLLYMGVMGWAAGCFVYARRDAFEAVGGFDESLYACEEIVLSRKLKRLGRFVVLRQSVSSSGRKLRMYSPWSIVPLALRFIRYGPAIFRGRQGMDWWYEGKRERH